MNDRYDASYGRTQDEENGGHLIRSKPNIETPGAYYPHEVEKRVGGINPSN